MNLVYLRQQLSKPFTITEKEQGVFEIGTPFSYANAASVVILLTHCEDFVVISDNGDFVKHYAEIIAQPGVSEVLQRSWEEFDVEQSAGELFTIGDMLYGLGPTIFAFTHALLVADAIISLKALHDEIDKRRKA